MVANTNWHYPGGRVSRVDRRLFKATLLATIVVSGVTPARAKLTGNVDLLKLTAQAHRTNQSRILTWQGQATASRQRQDDQGIRHKSNNAATFTVDTTVDAARWSWQVKEKYERVDGKLSAVKLHDLESREMRKGDTFFVYSPLIVTEADSWKYALVINPRKEARKRRGADSFDPFFYLSKAGTDLPGLLELNHRFAESSEMPNGYVKSEGDLVIWHTERDGIIRHHEFDLSKGGNLVLYYTTGPELDSRLEWAYEKQGDAWVPNSYHRQTKHKKDGQEEVSEETIEFTGNVVNESINPEMFTLKAMDVRPGTHVSDNRIGAIYYYGGEITELDDLVGEVFMNVAEVSPDPLPADTDDTKTSRSELPNAARRPNESRAEAATAPGSVAAETPASLQADGYKTYLLIGVVGLFLAVSILVLVARRKTRTEGA